MLNKEIDFDSFLREKHATQFIGLKDMIVDDYLEWAEELSSDEMIEYANEYAKEVINWSLKGEKING